MNLPVEYRESPANHRAVALMEKILIRSNERLTPEQFKDLKQLQCDMPAYVVALLNEIIKEFGAIEFIVNGIIRFLYIRLFIWPADNPEHQALLAMKKGGCPHCVINAEKLDLDYWEDLAYWEELSVEEQNYRKTFYSAPCSAGTHPRTMTNDCNARARALRSLGTYGQKGRGKLIEQAFQIHASVIPQLIGLGPFIPQNPEHFFTFINMDDLHTVFIGILAIFITMVIDLLCLRAKERNEPADIYDHTGKFMMQVQSREDVKHCLQSRLFRVGGMVWGNGVRLLTFSKGW